MRSRGRTNQAFTLVELMIVVSVLGILAAIVFPTVTNMQDEARINATIADMTAMQKGLLMYHRDNNAWPADVNQQLMPPGMEDYLPAGAFAKTPPTGGRYDFVRILWPPDVCVRIVTNDTASDAVHWQEIDDRIDNGDQTNGNVIRYVNSLALKVGTE